MSDDLDRAQAINEAHQAAALAAHFRTVRRLPEAVFAPLECEGCGEPIPEARLKAAPGCIRCVICQTRYERDVKGRK